MIQTKVWTDNQSLWITTPIKGYSQFSQSIQLFFSSKSWIIDMFDLIPKSGIVLVHDTWSNNAQFMHKLYLSLHFMNRLAGWEGGDTCNFIKKRLYLRCFSVSFNNIWEQLFRRTSAFSSFIFDLFVLQKQPFVNVLQNSCS